MKTLKKVMGLSGTCVVAAGLWAPLSADAATFGTGGTITFSGAIVAPSYGIASHVSENSQGFHTKNSSDKNASAVDVEFTPALNASPAAHVAVLVNTDAGVAQPQTLKTRFIDYANHATRAAQRAYDVGRAGGTLSIARGGQAERAVTVLVSYD